MMIKMNVFLMGLKGWFLTIDILCEAELLPLLLDKSLASRLRPCSIVKLVYGLLIIT